VSPGGKHRIDEEHTDIFERASAALAIFYCQSRNWARRPDIPIVHHRLVLGSRNVEKNPSAISLRILQTRS
jgi:hypothetical protein